MPNNKGEKTRTVMVYAVIVFLVYKCHKHTESELKDASTKTEQTVNDSIKKSNDSIQIKSSDQSK